MLTITGMSNGCCDGVNRRDFLKIGAMGIGGLTLADVLRAEAASGTGSSNKALINIHLGGGPSHQDMWDLKPDAPVEYRGEFNPIQTNVADMQICELFPRLARMADKFALVRGLVGSVNEHSSSTAMTGYRKRSLQAAGGRPSIGSVISKLAPNEKSLPFVSLMGNITSGYLGPIHQPYKPDGPGRSNLRLSQIDGQRLRSRTQLLQSLDRIRRDIDRSGKMEAMDAFSQQAVDTIISGRLADALDPRKEKPETLARYQGTGKGKYSRNHQFLTARRLIEAGVRCVAMRWGGWDTHSKNFITLRQQLPAMDMGLSALITDLYDRGMDKDVTVVVWGEFGRTPKVNKGAGRDHWPRVAAAFMSGGGMRTGQVIGASDRLAGEASQPVHLHEVHSTLYHNMGIDVKKIKLDDRAGRPQYLLDIRKPIESLI